MSEIMNCPFCNGRAIMRERFINGVANVKHYRLECADCHASFLNWNKNTSKAIAAWNRRAQPENSRQHALQTGVCPMCEDCPDGCPVETPNDSRNKQENEPLTLDELRQMDGEPVYVVTLDNPLENQPYWAIAGINSNDSRYQNGVALYNRVQDDWGAFDLYGDTWLAYRRKPEWSAE